MNTGNTSLNNVPDIGIENNTLNIDISKDEIDRLLEVVNSALGALTPMVGTAREFRDDQRDLCKLGLEITKLALNGFKAFGIVHGNTPVVGDEKI